MMAIGPERRRFWSASDKIEVPPNALIDHWPAACNRLDSLDFRAQQRMLILKLGQTCH